ncbi:MAG: hypothetical protein SYNGOMJ08_00170 [Candidatus Syntrophoarchaeum sp. GoM_oil]|nr:MAG: hypothetical protein SYNGOMJ08_00170 [Candidatus Syntrophoarchaeum sp. GoM_oil]
MKDYYKSFDIRCDEGGKCVITEADTCRKYVTPKLYGAGWIDEQINEQKTFTDGRIIVIGDEVRRKRPK